jgi:hypothetical protein
VILKRGKRLTRLLPQNLTQNFVTVWDWLKANVTSDNLKEFPSATDPSTFLTDAVYGWDNSPPPGVPLFAYYDTDESVMFVSPDGGTNWYDLFPIQEVRDIFNLETTSTATTRTQVGTTKNFTTNRKFFQISATATLYNPIAAINLSGAVEVEVVVDTDTYTRVAEFFHNGNDRAEAVVTITGFFPCDIGDDCTVKFFAHMSTATAVEVECLLTAIF